MSDVKLSAAMSIELRCRFDSGSVSEAELQSLVVAEAKAGGWRMYHTYNSMRSAKGFPDWAFVRGSTLVFAELKREDGKATEDQAAWLAALRKVHEAIFTACGMEFVRVFLWKPSDWAEIKEVLK